MSDTLQLEFSPKRNDLSKGKQLRDDKHLQPFLAIPGEDNGFDIEGLAVNGARLILAGPTLALDGPVSVLRWRGGAEPDSEAMVPTEALERVLDVPYGQGVDHAEGMTLFAPDGGDVTSILVVYDAASMQRKLTVHAVTADIFTLA